MYSPSEATMIINLDERNPLKEGGGEGRVVSAYVLVACIIGDTKLIQYVL